MTTAAPRTPRPGYSRRRWLAGLEGAGYLAPLLLFLGGLIVIPVAGTVIGSFWRDVTFAPREFTGLGNYAFLLKEPAFRQSLVFTLAFVLVSVPLELGLGLGYALLMNYPSPWRSWLRTAILIPWIIPIAVSARIWELIFNFQFGLANVLLLKLHCIAEPVNWLGTPAHAFAVLVAGDVWKTAPFAAILLLTGLVMIPRDLYEQARVDGAGAWQSFAYITLPLLRPVLLVALLFRTIDALRIFDLVFVLTRGGPGGATTSLSLLGYQAFTGGDYGYGSAVSVILFAVAFGLSLLYLKSYRFQDEP